MDIETSIAILLREKLTVEVIEWKRELRYLANAPARMGELQALISFAEDDTRASFPVASRPIGGNVNLVEPARLMP